MGVSSSSTGCGGSRRASGLQGVKRAATGRPGTSRRGTSPTERPNGNSLEASLLAIRAPQDPQKVLQELGALQPKQLSGALLALQRITEKPITEFAPQPSTLRDVAAKLKLVNEATPDYWPTVLRFIQFASAGLSPNVPPPGTAATITIVGFVTLPEFKNCVAVLDGGDVGPTRFENRRVRFTQDPVHFLNVTFVNCVFEMPDTASPRPYLKRASQILLNRTS